MITKNNITGIILAGGKSFRMGSDKGFLLLNQKAFVQYSIDALSPLVSEIIIVSDHSAYDTFGYKRVNDITKNAGPVAGIISGLEATQTTYNIILSCDIPLINTKILSQLITAATPNTSIIQLESHGKSMPLIALYNKQVLPIFKEQLQNNERRLRMVVNACGYKTITLSDKDTASTKNVNTQTEFKEVKDAYTR